MEGDFVALCVSSIWGVCTRYGNEHGGERSIGWAAFSRAADIGIDYWNLAWAQAAI